MQVAAIQCDIHWQDKEANYRQIEDTLARADLPSGTFVLLPELVEVGFSNDIETIVDDRSLIWASTTARRFNIWLQHGFARKGPDGKARNCAAIISPDGTISGIYEKLHPFSYGRESEAYSGGDHLLLRQVEDMTICPAICYDLRFPELWRIATGVGAEVFMLGANWPDARQSHWRILAIARAIENQAFVVAVNRVGSDPHLSYAGGSIIIAPDGEILAEADDKPAVLHASLDLDRLRNWRATFPALVDIRSELLGSIDLDTTIENTLT